MFRPAVTASITGRVGRDADAGSLAPCERSVYRRSRGLARLGGELIVESHEQKQSNRKVVVVVAEQAASEQSRTTTTATGMVGRILTAAAAQISERSPTPHVYLIFPAGNIGYTYTIVYVYLIFPAAGESNT